MGLWFFPMNFHSCTSFKLSQNAYYALILDHLWIINIWKDTLRQINRYIKERNIGNKVFSPPQLYVHGQNKWEGLEFSKKYDKRKVEINGMGWNLQQDLRLPGQKTSVIFYKTYHKMWLVLSKKRYRWVYFILCCSSWRERAFLKNPQHFFSTYLYTFDLEKT